MGCGVYAIPGVGAAGAELKLVNAPDAPVSIAAANPNFNAKPAVPANKPPATGTCPKVAFEKALMSGLPILKNSNVATIPASKGAAGPAPKKARPSTDLLNARDRPSPSKPTPLSAALLSTVVVPFVALAVRAV